MNADKTNVTVALAAILAMAASAVLLHADYRSEAENHRRVMLARAQTALDALAAGIRAQGRMGRYRHDRLSVIFEELAAAPDVSGVVLRAADGAVVASGGDAVPMDGTAPGEDRWLSGTLVVSRGFDITFGGGPGLGRGRGFQGPAFGPEPDTADAMPDGPYVLSVAMDTAGMRAEIQGDRVRFGVSLAGSALVVALGAAVALGAVRRRRLQTALIVAREQAAHQAQLAQIGAGLAHETKNPLGIVRGEAQLIADAPADSEGNRERASRIVDEIDRTVGHINGFLGLARPPEIEAGAVSLRAFLEDFARLVEGEAGQRGVELVVEAPEVTVSADAAQLRKALLNLVINALHATAPGGRITIAATLRDERIDLTVRDTGCGIAPEDLPRVTEPYFTRFEGGCGLGLSIVEQIARAHGWSLEIESTPGAGTAVTLRGLKQVHSPHG